MNELNATELTIAASLLLLFGVVYNAIVHHLEKIQANLWGYTSFFVALGTSLTLLGTWRFIGTDNLLIVVGAFICTGIPMIIGSAWRYVSAQTRQRLSTFEFNREALETAERILRNGYTTKTGKT